MYSDLEWDYYFDGLQARREGVGCVHSAGSLGAGWSRCQPSTNMGSAIKESQQRASTRLLTRKT